MSIASHFFVGSPDEAARNDGLEGGSDDRRAVFYRVTETGLEPLYQIIAGKQCPSFEPAAMSEGYDLITFAFPTEFTDSLAALDAAGVDDAIAKWAADPECPYDNDGDLRDLLSALVRLAGVAKSGQGDLYLWNCL